MGEKEPFPRCSQSNTRKPLRASSSPSLYALENFVQLGQEMCAALQGEQHQGVLAAKGCPASKVHSRPLLLQCLHGGNKVQTTAPVRRNPSDGNDQRCCEGPCPAEERTRAEGIRIIGDFRPSGCIAPSLDDSGLCVRFLRALVRFLLEGARGGEGVGTRGGLSVSNTVIGGGEGE
jgi:hypothetical protein